MAEDENAKCVPIPPPAKSSEEEAEAEAQRFADLKEKDAIRNEEIKKEKKKTRLLLILTIFLFIFLALSCLMLGYMLARKRIRVIKPHPYTPKKNCIYFAGRNLALDSKATISSGDTQNLAIDGDFKNLDINKGSCATTMGTDNFPWLCLKLENTTFVQGVVIRSTTFADASYDYLELRIGTYEECTKDEPFYRNGLCARYGEKSITPGQEMVNDCRPYNLVGQYVSVQLYKGCVNCILTICELEIYGYNFTSGLYHSVAKPLVGL
uniref:Fucolectin tachylectin-4 pentraxin-1 domain-containing protein n=1 Tax=Strigamia maritima TaxID=126957 RepID=T1J0S3_STRMM